jgi:hypothetical protein
MCVGKTSCITHLWNSGTGSDLMHRQLSHIDKSLQGAYSLRQLLAPRDLSANNTVSMATETTSAFELI